MSKQKICEFCGEVYSTRGKYFCSPSCRSRAFWEKRGYKDLRKNIPSLNLDDEKIAQLYKKGFSSIKIGGLLRCSSRTIRTHLNKLGISLRTHRQLYASGRTGLKLFEPGHEPWNRGVSVRLNPSGEFKKGHVAWNKGLLGFRKGHPPAYLSNKVKKRISIKIRALGHSGPNSVNWKGGVTPFYHCLRSLDEYKTWRITCLKKDWFRCQECYSKEDVIVHHKIPFKVLVNEFLAKYNQFSVFDDREILVRLALTHEPFWDIDNGKTLCKKCHKSLEAKLRHSKEKEERCQI